MLFLNCISILKQYRVFKFCNRQRHLEYTRILTHQREKGKQPDRRMSKWYKQVIHRTGQLKGQQTYVKVSKVKLAKVPV